MKKIGIIDVVILLIIVLTLIVGFFTYKHFRQTADKQIESTAKIGFQVFLRGVTITSGVNPIKPGDDTFISIRNVPYTNLKVVDVRADAKKILMPNPAKNPPFIIVDDYSQLYMYDIIVTIVDTAKITKDGAVVGGNKIKIGLPITLEGKDYKFNGTVSNVQIMKDEPAKALPGKKPEPPKVSGPVQQVPQPQQSEQAQSKVQPQAVAPVQPSAQTSPAPAAPQSKPPVNVAPVGIKK